MHWVVLIVLASVSTSVFGADLTGRAGGLGRGEIAVLEAEQRRLEVERNALEQKQRFETEQRRLYEERANRATPDINRYRPPSLPPGRAPDAVYRNERYKALAQERFLKFYEFVTPALRKGDYEAVEFAARQMRIIGEDESLTEGYYEKLRALLPPDQ